jgi:hypothetical protein
VVEKPSPAAAKVFALVVEKKKPLSMVPSEVVESLLLNEVQSEDARNPFCEPEACARVSTPPVNVSGPEKVVAWTVPFAAVLRSALEVLEITSAVVDAIPVESDVVVAPVAVMFWKELVPEKVFAANVFGIVLEPAMNAFTRVSV